MKINRSTLLQWTIPALKQFNPLAVVLLIKMFCNIIQSLLSKIIISKTKSVVDIQPMDKISHQHIKIDWLYLKRFYYQIRNLILLDIWLVTKPQRHACLKLEIINYFWNMSFPYKMHQS